VTLFNKLKENKTSAWKFLTELNIQGVRRRIFLKIHIYPPRSLLKETDMDPYPQTLAHTQTVITVSPQGVVLSPQEFTVW